LGEVRERSRRTGEEKGSMFVKDSKQSFGEIEVYLLG
jgi:hypothetical protein